MKTSDGQIFDIIFVGNDKGQVLKIVNFAGQPSEGQPRAGPVLVEELQVLKYGQPVLGLQLSTKKVEGKEPERRLLVVARDEILVLPLARCSVAASCSACVQLQDPYCGWNIVSSKCVSHNTFNPMYASEFLQNVTVGRHRQCGDSESSVIIEEFKDGREDGLRLPSPSPIGENKEVNPSIMIEQPSRGRYSTEELSMAVATSCVSALLLGFIAGFLLARKCQCGSDNPYHVPYLNRFLSILSHLTYSKMTFIFHPFRNVDVFSVQSWTLIKASLATNYCEHTRYFHLAGAQNIPSKKCPDLI